MTGGDLFDVRNKARTLGKCGTGAARRLETTAPICTNRLDTIFIC